MKSRKTSMSAKSSAKKIRTLITGGAGFIGSHLSEYLLDRGHEVICVDNFFTGSKQNVAHLLKNENFELIRHDVTLPLYLEVDEIYNLAAHSFVGDSWEDVRQVNMINYLAVISLLDIIKHSPLPIKFYQASTGEMFGSSDETGVQTEETPFHPRSPYAVSKLAAYEIVNNYRDSYALFCCNGICFNHESPLRAEHFVTRKISLGAAKIKLGQQHTIELGNLDSVRDWGFAGDYVEAMWLMLQQEKPQDFVVGTGKAWSVKECAQIAFESVGLNWENHVEVDKKYLRPAEVDLLVADPKKAREVLGWRPKTSFEEMMRLMVEADLEQEKRQG